ncbi:MAG: hypothetical protein N4A72_15215 [Bacteroidales bacterium]|nr:hypothetical protein [Bacteroidales bacterium]
MYPTYCHFPGQSVKLPQTNVTFPGITITFTPLPAKFPHRALFLPELLVEILQ